MRTRTDSVRDLPMRNRILRSRRVDWIIPNWLRITILVCWWTLKLSLHWKPKWMQMRVPIWPCCITPLWECATAKGWMQRHWLISWMPATNVFSTFPVMLYCVFSPALMPTGWLAMPNIWLKRKPISMPYATFPTGTRNVTFSMWAKWLRPLLSATTGSITN